jgi:hypothetical protein
MRTIRLVACFALLTAALALAQTPPPADAPRPSDYASLVARAQAGEHVDFQRLRLAWMESPERKAAQDTGKEEEAMVAAINARDFATALKNADAVVASRFINLDGHFAAYVANQELHREDRAAFHRAIFSGLLDSIFDSGDGKSPQTAWVVIDVQEEYVVLRVLGLAPSKQSVVHEGERAFDRMECTNRKTGEAVTLYFDVTIPMKHYLE